MATKKPTPKASGRKDRTSKYFGVNKVKGQEAIYVAHAYDSEKARPVHLGTFEDEEEAARAHDIATLKCSGSKARYNFPVSEYEETMKLMKNMTKQQVVDNIRRSSSRFARGGDSNYRGVTRKPNTKRWSAYKGAKKTFLGSFVTQEEAAMAYDVETIKRKGWNALTNFDIKFYNVEAILAASANPDNAAEDKDSFFKKEPLDMPNYKYRIGKGKLFLEQLHYWLRGETRTGGTYETSDVSSNYFVDQNAKEVAGPYCFAAGAGSKFKHSGASDFKPCHFGEGVGKKFQHSSSSSFKPYNKRAKLG